ncbi:hypothetical protein BJ508DRAFT_313085 [Ascobolus immersus RN42]|uniref:Uncharacterized protein n=1 Tax=Ascobolus immersus RN42 TaxID=1160509 RepID=A0A3N4HWY7_ASCIM|nr:hypothetical protein BJ508DRAFT_313085 [Ascobolus immersus RN42]
MDSNKNAQREEEQQAFEAGQGAAAATAQNAVKSAEDDVMDNGDGDKRGGEETNNGNANNRPAEVKGKTNMGDAEAANAAVDSYLKQYGLEDEAARLAIEMELQLNRTGASPAAHGQGAQGDAVGDPTIRLEHPVLVPHAGGPLAAHAGLPQATAAFAREMYFCGCEKDVSYFPVAPGFDCEYEGKPCTTALPDDSRKTCYNCTTIGRDTDKPVPVAQFMCSHCGTALCRPCMLRLGRGNNGGLHAGDEDAIAEKRRVFGHL